MKTKTAVPALAQVNPNLSIQEEVFILKNAFLFKGDILLPLGVQHHLPEAPIEKSLFTSHNVNNIK